MRYFCKKKGIEVDKGKVFAYCLRKGCPKLAVCIHRKPKNWR